ncbi:MAG: hypothetical protein JRD02_04375 [Deltaproteobacteria bacterium]|nr:hypothetical protein [Deltaproteobacteria bacterium]
MAELLFRAQERPVEHHIVQANGSLNPDYGPGLLANEFSEKSGLCQHPFGRFNIKLSLGGCPRIGFCYDRL